MTWGIEQRHSSQTLGDWIEYDHKEIYDHIDEQDSELIPDLEKLAQENLPNFCRLQDDAQSILEIAGEQTDSYITRIAKRISNLKLITQEQISLSFFPNGGSVMSYDSRARQAGFRLPPHLEYQADLKWLQQPTSLLLALTDHCVALAKHFARLESTGSSSMTTKKNKRIFIGHGRSTAWKDLRDFLRDTLNLEFDEFNREATAGITIIERLNTMLNAAGMAFIILTAEDETSEGTKRARMNCIHEAGLFQGRLGFERAIIMLEDDCEEFSNINGLTQIRFPKNDIMARSETIRNTLKREGFIS